MFKRKKKQKLKNYKAYFHPHSTLLLWVGMFWGIAAVVLGMFYVIGILKALWEGENITAILTSLPPHVILPGLFALSAWVWIQTSQEALVLTSEGISYCGIGVTLFTRWEDTVRIECQKRLLVHKLKLISEDIELERLWWRIGATSDNIPLWRTLPLYGLLKVSLPESHPLLEDILCYAPHVEIVGFGQRRKKWWCPE